jgi:hypothetical protein
MTTTKAPHDIAVELHSFGENGGTVSTVRGVPVPKSGYVVGVSGFGIKVPTPPFPDVSLIEEWVKWRLPYATGVNRGMGSWTDNGYVYFDVVETYGEKLTAMLKARQRGEIAVWDISKGEEINTVQWFKDNPTDATNIPWTHRGYNKERHS